MQRRLFLAMSVLLVSTACGSSSDNTTTGPTNNNNNNSARSMSAKIDGASWVATTVGAGVTNGIAILAASNGTQTIGLSFVPSVGTQTVTATGIVIGQLTIAGQTWQTSGNSGGSGSVTVTTATTNHLVGTFSFTAPALTTGATPATRQVTAGVFDVTF
jgi:hypothetical protein